MTEQSEPRLYAISSGNGNDGVSHLFPDYYVRTDDPWTLARAAMISEFKAGAGHAFALENMDVDGEAEYVLSAVISDPPDENGRDTGIDDETSEYPISWSDVNGAWRIIEVFPDDGPNMNDPWHRLVYDNLEACFAADVLALARKDA